MPSNLKKLIEARMAATGETWATAQKHVRSKANREAPPSLLPTTTREVALSKHVVFALIDPSEEHQERLLRVVFGDHPEIRLEVFPDENSARDFAQKVLRPVGVIISLREGTKLSRESAMLNYPTMTIAHWPHMNFRFGQESILFLADEPIARRCRPFGKRDIVCAYPADPSEIHAWLNSTIQAAKPPP